MISSLRRGALACASLTACATFLASSAARAQESVADVEVDEGIVVTGSRIVRDGSEAPVPTTVLGSDEILARGLPNVTDYVNQLPQMGVPTSARTVGFVAPGGNAGASFLNTRGLGPTRTLVLLDGRRVVAASIINAVDTNLLPTNLVKQVDIVTGGASAAYGSDAVAGVVNFVLDKRYTGIKGSLSNGISDYGDAHYWTADLAAGASFGGGRGHVLLSGQIFRGDPVTRADSRKWYKGTRLITNPAFTPSNGQPGNLVRSDIGLTSATDGGLITSGPRRGTQFLADGQPANFAFGSIVAGTIQAGGTEFDGGAYFGLLALQEYESLFGRASYDLTDTITAFVEGGYGHSYGENISTPYYRYGNITISNQNPFIPAGVNMAGITSFNMGRTNVDLVDPDNPYPGLARNTRKQTRVVAGLEGTLGASARWELYYQYGRSQLHLERLNNAIIANFNQAIDAIANPAVGGVANVATGTPICRVKLTNAASLCVPLNPFGVGQSSLAAINFVNGVTEGLKTEQRIDFRQHVLAGSLQVEPFSLWAGPVSLAIGGEYREEKYTADADAASLAGRWNTGNFQPSAGRFNVKEGFAEILVPLLKQSPLGHALELNGAVRYTDYSVSGTVTTWKGGLTYQPVEGLILRGTRSRDIRAPNLSELFSAGVQTLVDVTDPTQPTRPTVQARQLSGGNLNLKPERANTLTLGAVYRPRWLPGLSLAVDYYKIEVRDAIVSQGAQAIINQCFGFGVVQNSAVCASVLPASSGTLQGATILTGGVNAQSQEVRGIDYELSYRDGLDAIASSLPGQFDLRLLVSQRLTQRTTLAGTIDDQLGVYLNLGGAGPKWRGIMTAGYSVGGSRSVLTLRYMGPGKVENLPVGNPNTVDLNKVDDILYVDLAQNFDIKAAGVNFTFFMGIDNLFNAGPPVVAATGVSNLVNNGASTLHDLVGRSYRAGIRFRY